MKKDRIVLFTELLVILFIALVPLIWFHPGEMILGHDTGIRLNPLEHLRNVFFSWESGTNMGRDWTITKGFLVAKFPETFFYLLTRSFQISQPLTYIFWILVMAGSMYVVLRTFFSKPEQWFIRLWGPVLFVYNFFILQAWSIVERAKFSAYAGLPLLFLFWYQGLTGARSAFVTGVAMGITVFFLNGGSSPPLFGGILVTLGITALVLTYFNAKTHGWKKALWTLLTHALAAVVITCALNAYWVLPQIYLYLTSYKDALAGMGGTQGILEWEAQVSREASLANLLRLQGVPGMLNLTQYPFMHTFQTNPLLILASFIPIVSIIMGLLFFWKRLHRERALIVSLFITLLVGIIFTAGTHPPFGFIYTFFINHVPGFTIFRSSFLKFAPAVWFPVAFLSGYFLWHLTQTIRISRVRTASRVTLLILVMGFQYPFLNSVFFTWNPPFSTKVTIPSYVSDTFTELRRTILPTQRILLAPPLDPATAGDGYTWGFWSLSTLPNVSLSLSTVANDSHNHPPIIDDIYEALDAGDTQTAVSLFRRTGIRTILWRDDILWTDKKTTAVQFATMKQTIQSITKQASTHGSWTIYTLQESPLPIIRAASTISVIYGKRPRLSTFAQTVTDATAVTFSPPAIHEQMRPLVHLELVGAQCIYCRQSERNDLARAMRIVAPRILPTSPLYFLVSWREREQSKRAATTTEQIDAMLAFANRRLAELVRLSPKTLEYQKSARQYQTLIEDTMKSFDTLTGLDNATYAVKIAAYVHAQQQFIYDHHANIPTADSESFLGMLEKAQQYLYPHWWINDEKTHTVRLLLPTQKEGTYRFILPHELLKNATLVVDQKKIQSDVLTLAPAVHTIEIKYYDPHPDYDVPFIRAELQEVYAEPTPPTISFVRVNPTLYRVHVPARNAPIVLIFGEAYHPQWILASYKDKTLSRAHHFTVSGYANGWVVPKGPAIDATISYFPQQIFYIGLGITIISIIGMSFWLVQNQTFQIVLQRPRAPSTPAHHLMA